MVTINIGRKEAVFFGAIILVFLIVGLGVAYDWNDPSARQGSDASIHGHTANEVDGLGGVGCGFGDYETKSSGVSYTAATDGMVVVFQSDRKKQVYGYTPSNTLVIRDTSADVDNLNDAAGFSFPVKKGNTWKVTGGERVSWVPLNCGGGGAGGGSRAWVNFDGINCSVNNECVIRASYNVEKVVRTGTGLYTIYFENQLEDENYACLITSETISNRAPTSLHVVTGGMAAGSVSIRTLYGADFNVMNAPSVYLSIFR